MRIKKEDIEKDFDVITTKIKRVKNPNDFKYEGNNGYEHRKAMFDYMGTLSPEDVQLLGQGKLFSSLENTNKFLDEIKEGDSVGIKEFKYEVVSKSPNGFTGNVKGKVQPMDVSLEQIDLALATKFAEILYRDGIPYNLEDEDVQILIKKPTAKTAVLETCEVAEPETKKEE